MLVAIKSDSRVGRKNNHVLRIGPCQVGYEFYTPGRGLIVTNKYVFVTAQFVRAANDRKLGFR